MIDEVGNLKVVDFTKLPEGATVLVETELQVWELTVIKPIQLPDGFNIDAVVVEVGGTDERFKRRVIRGVFVGAVDKETQRSRERCLVGGWEFILHFSDINLIAGPVLSAYITTDKWKYEAIPNGSVH